MIVRVNKTRNYTVMSNYHLQDNTLSLKAKGLLSVVLSLPDNWEYSVAGLVAICRENETAIKSCLQELKGSGYLVMTKKLPNETASGRYEYEYDFYEQPQKQGTENQEVEILPLEVLQVENQGQLNTNIENTKQENTKGLNIYAKQTRFIPPSVEEVAAYCLERNNNIDAQQFIDFYTSKGWLIGKTQMKDWKAAVRTWERNRNSSKPQTNTATQYGNPFTELKKREGIL